MELAVSGTLEARYDGTCAIDREHSIKRKTRIGTLVDMANPMRTVSGFACAACVASLPKAPRVR